MADKYTALKEDAQFLWEHGRTHNGAVDSEKEAMARGERYRERAVRTFYRLGDFSREDIRNTDIWRYTLLFLMGTLKDADKNTANSYFGTEFKEKTEELRDKFQAFCQVTSTKEKLFALLRGLVFLALSVIVFFSTNEKVLQLLYYIILIPAFVLTVGGFCVGISYGILAGLFGGFVGLLISALVLWFPTISVVTRILTTVMLLIPAVLSLSKIYTTTEFYQTKQMKNPKALKEFMSLRKEAETLTKEVQKSLEALDEFSSDRCSSAEYESICEAITFTRTTTIKKRSDSVVYGTWDEETETEEYAFTLHEARKCAANLIDHYKGPLTRLQSAMNRQRKRLESVGVKVPEKC